MKDLIYLADKQEFLRLREELKMKGKQIVQLRKIIKEMESEKVQVNSQPLPNPVKLVKIFMQLYKNKYNIGYYISNWATAAVTMQKVISAFYSEGETNIEIEEFFKWAIIQKLHTGATMRLGYLPTIIQDYRDHLLSSPLPKKVVEIPLKADAIDKIFNRRFDQ